MSISTSSVIAALHKHAPVLARDLAELLDAPLEDVYAALVALEGAGLARVQVIHQAGGYRYGQWEPVSNPRYAAWIAGAA